MQRHWRLCANYRLTGVWRDWIFGVASKLVTDWQSRTSAGREFQMDGTTKTIKVSDNESSHFTGPTESRKKKRPENDES